MKRTSVSFFILTLAIPAVGCGSKATVTGTVTYKDKPIPSGTILFAPDSGAPSVNAPINDGKYTAERVPTGPAKVSITSVYTEGEAQFMAKKMGGKMGPPKDAPIPPEARKAFEEESTQLKKGIKIPDQYGDPATSGLTFTVKSGRQTKDFKLE